MSPAERKELMQLWSILGASLLALSDDKQSFLAFVRDEMGYQWDGKGWRKTESLH